MNHESGRLHCHEEGYAGMLSVEMPDSERLFLARSNRSKSCVDSVAASKARSRTQTLGRLLSVEGLDLGLPGVYRSKGDGDVISLPKADCGHWRFRGALFRPASGTDRRRPMSMLVGDSAGILPEMSVSDVTLSTVPPKKPPRTKIRQRIKSAETEEKDNLGNFMATVSVLEHHTRPCGDRVADNNKTLELTDGIKWEYSPIYTEGQKPLETTTCEPTQSSKDTDPRSRQLLSEKSFKFKMSLSRKREKRPSREQLKASLSVPFDFRKVSGGKMPETQPIDLLRPYCHKGLNDAAEQHDCLPDIPPRRHRLWQDDSVLLSTCAIQGPDILSHLNTDKFQNHPLVAEKYQTMMHRGKNSTFTGFKKASWFSRHLPHKKRNNKDALSEPLLWVRDWRDLQGTIANCKSPSYIT